MFDVSYGHSPNLGCSILTEKVTKARCHRSIQMLKDLLGSRDSRNWTWQGRGVYLVACGRPLGR